MYKRQVSQASTRIYNASEQGDVVAGSIRQVSLAEGVLYSAADNYGAQIHVPSEHGGYQQQVVPAPGYVEKSTDVVAGQEGAYVLQPQQERVLHLPPASSSSASIVLSGLPYDDIVLARNLLVASHGNTLYTVARKDHGQRSSLTLGGAQTITGLAAHGDLLVAMSDVGNLYRIDLDSGEIQLWLEGQSADRLALDGSYYYAATGEVLTRVSLLDDTSASFSTGAGNISALLSLIHI